MCTQHPAHNKTPGRLIKKRSKRRTRREADAVELEAARLLARAALAAGHRRARARARARAGQHRRDAKAGQAAERQRGEVRRHAVAEGAQRLRVLVLCVLVVVLLLVVLLVPLLVRLRLRVLLLLLLLLLLRVRQQLVDGACVACVSHTEYCIVHGSGLRGCACMTAARCSLLFFKRLRTTLFCRLRANCGGNARRRRHLRMALPIPPAPSCSVLTSIKQALVLVHGVHGCSRWRRADKRGEPRARCVLRAQI